MTTANLTATTTIGTETYAHDPRVVIQERALGGAEVYCPICNRSEPTSGPRAFGPRSHRAWCDLVGESVYAFVPASSRAAVSPVAHPAATEEIRAAGFLFANMDELVTAVRSGCVSMSAAMNRDF